jgi:hypothetical protein
MANQQQIHLLLESSHGLAFVDELVSILFEYHGILVFSKNVVDRLRFFDESFAGPVNSAAALPRSETPVEARRGSAREVFRRVSSLACRWPSRTPRRTPREGGELGAYVRPEYVEASRRAEASTSSKGHPVAMRFTGGAVNWRRG